MHLRKSSSVSLSHSSWITFCISSNEWIRCLWALTFILVMRHRFSMRFRSGDWAGHSMRKRPNFWHHFVVIFEVWYRAPSSIQIISPLSSTQSLKNGSPSSFRTEFIRPSFFKKWTGPFKPRVMAPQMPIDDLPLLNVGLKYRVSIAAPCIQSRLKSSLIYPYTILHCPPQMFLCPSQSSLIVFTR